MYQGYLELYGQANSNQKRLASGSQSFSFWYRYWKNNLFEQTVHIFVWDTNNEIPNTEIEKITMWNGTSGVTDKYKNSKGHMGVFNGVNCGKPTIYFDLWQDYQIISPLDSRILKINKDVVMIMNNSCKTSVEPLIHTFAVLLAHTDVSIINKLINAREKAVPIAGSKSQLRALENYRSDLANGKVTPIYDPALSFVDFKTIPSSNDMNLAELQEFKRTTLEMFLNAIGIKTSHEKKGNMIEEEVAANDSLIVFNIDDMFNCRKTACDEINALFGRDWSVKKSECIDYKKSMDELMRKESDNNEESDAE